MLITVHVSTDSELDAEAIERRVEEKYGDDNDIEVDVMQNGGPEVSEESKATALWIYAALCVAILVLCVVALTSMLC